MIKSALRMRAGDTCTVLTSCSICRVNKFQSIMSSPNSTENLSVPRPTPSNPVPNLLAEGATVVAVPVTTQHGTVRTQPIPTRTRPVTVTVPSWRSQHVSTVRAQPILTRPMTVTVPSRSQHANVRAQPILTRPVTVTVPSRSQHTGTVLAQPLLTSPVAVPVPSQEQQTAQVSGISN